MQIEFPLHYSRISACYLLRLLPPETTRHFSNHHDATATTFLAQLLEATDFPATAIARAHLPLAHSGLGLSPASCTATHNPKTSTAQPSQGGNTQPPHTAFELPGKPSMKVPL